MLWLNIVKALFLIVMVAASYRYAKQGGHPVASSIAIGVLIAFAAFGLEYLLNKKRLKDILVILLGVLIGIMTGVIFGLLISIIPGTKNYLLLIYTSSILFFSYTFSVILIRKKDELLRDMEYEGKKKPRRESRSKAQNSSIKIIDTSAIIDGRIVELYKTGVLEGTLIMPRFILKELQNIADSKDHERRVKGRHGLDIVKQLKEINPSNLIITKDDIPHIKEVDSKLIELAVKRHAKLVTTDYNLQEMAEIRGIGVINLNQISIALKPPLNPGDKIRIKLVREGKEKTQAVGYLVDGTMVVVDNAASLIGKEIDCYVHSIIQQDTGRIVFGRLHEK